MDGFENKVFEGIPYSRIIASWNKVSVGINYHLFKKWLGTLTINGKKIPEDVIRDIAELADNGKMELESSAKNFIRENQKK